MTRADVALVFNIPTLKQCLKAVLDEVVVEKVYIALEMEGINKQGTDIKTRCSLLRSRSALLRNRL